MKPANLPPSSRSRLTTKTKANLAPALDSAESVDVTVPGPLATTAGRFGPLSGSVVRVILANLEMGGILFDGLTRWRRIVLLSALAGLVLDYFARPHLTVAVAFWLALVLFVLRQSFLLLSFTPAGVADQLKSRYGLHRGGEAYEGITALFFYHRSYSFSLLVEKTAFADVAWLVPYAPYLRIVGWLAILAGLGVNTWAFLLIGRPAYYYLDMYYGRFLQPFSHRGPYRIFRNPMYSVGQFPSYGLALIYGSYWGLLFTVANQVCCYVFYYVAELPHIRAVLNRPAESVP